MQKLRFTFPFDNKNQPDEGMFFSYTQLTFPLFSEKPDKVGRSNLILKNTFPVTDRQ